MADDLQVPVGSGGDPYMRTKESPATAGRHMQVVVAGSHKRVYDGVQSLTLTGSALALTIPVGATMADIYCDGVAGTDTARYWHAGVAPTATVGKQLTGDQEIPSADPASFQAIIKSGAPVLRIEYYHYA